MSEPRELRIVLSIDAAKAYETMLARLKTEMPQVKAQPSHFVSFLVTDYLNAHFERDKSVLVAEFFDMDAFFTAERKKARGMSDFDEQMQAALDRARQIKSKRRRAKSPSVIGEKRDADEKL